jgi:hypothetical protein
MAQLHRTLEGLPLIDYCAETDVFLMLRVWPVAAPYKLVKAETLLQQR